MATFFTILTLLAFLYVLFTLIMGTLSMAGKNKEDRTRSNKWMFRRVYGQTAAIILLIITVALRRNGA